MCKKIAKWFFLVILFLILIVGVAAGVAYKTFLTPTGGIKEPVVIEIKKGDTLMKTASTLEDLGAIKDGRIFIAAPDQASGEKALKVVQDITRELQVGETYTGKVVRIVPFGAFLEILPGRDGLLHISQIAHERTERVEDVLLDVPSAGVLANDVDIDGDALSALLVDGPANGALTLDADGGFRYQPKADFNGSDAFTYRASDGALDSELATVAITVSPVNDAPVAAGESYATDEDVALSIAAPGVLANDVDADSQSLTAVLDAQPSHGSLNLKPNGAFVYTPNKNYNGGDSFRYKASDGESQSAAVTVNLAVGDVGDPPQAVGDAIEVAQAGTATLLTSGEASVLANDIVVDAGKMTAELTQAPVHGKLTLNPNGTFSYTHDGSLTWSDSFAYIAKQNGLASNQATVQITIRPIARFTFEHTVGIAGLPNPCASPSVYVPRGTEIQHCYTMRNTGLTPFTLHTLEDSRLGLLLDNHRKRVDPGQSFTHTATETATSSANSAAVWKAVNPNLPQPLGGAATDAVQWTTRTADVIITVAKDGADSDKDAIPDNVEGAGDVDSDGTPNFLDTDSDGDGVSDKAEAGPNPAKPLDSDGDGVPDYLDADTPSQETETNAVYLPSIQG